MTSILPLAMTRAEPKTMAFEALYERHFARVFHLGLRYGAGDAAFAEDVAHEVFLKLVVHLPSLDARDDLGGWLYRVTANEALSRLRKERSFTRWLSRVFRPDAATEPDTTAAADRAFESREAASAVLAALATLPAKERVVLCMLLLDGQSQQEIGRALSLSKGYVSKLVARGLAALRAAGWEVHDADV